MVESRYGHRWPIIEATGEQQSSEHVIFTANDDDDPGLLIEVDIMSAGPYAFRLTLDRHVLNDQQVGTLQVKLATQVLELENVDIMASRDAVDITFKPDALSTLGRAVQVAVLIGEVFLYTPDEIQLILDYDPEGVPFQVGAHWPGILESLKAERGEPSEPIGFPY